MTRSRRSSPTSDPCPVNSLRPRPRRRSRRVIFALAAVLAAAAGLPAPGSARSLDAVRFRGTIGICAHPNALPFANKFGEPPGFQLELGRALAEKLGVSLTPVWVISPIQIRR